MLDGFADAGTDLVSALPRRRRRLRSGDRALRRGNDRPALAVRPTTPCRPTADFFVGQPDGVSNVPNAGAGSQNESAAGVHSPGAITVAHGSLYVADRVNFRVVVWSPRPATTGEQAVAVLGPGALDGSVDPLEGQGFTPRGLGVVGDRLYLSDSNVAFGTSRVLVYQLENLP